MNKLFTVFILGLFSISLFLSCDVTDTSKKIEVQKSVYWYSFTEKDFIPMPKIPAVLDNETNDKILDSYLTEINKEIGWDLTIDDVWIEKYYGIYNDCAAVLLYNKHLVPGDGIYINDELEIVVGNVSFLYGPIIGSTITIYKNEILYNLQEAYDNELLTMEDLKSIAYYQNDGYIIPQRTQKTPMEKKILWEGDINMDFDDKTIIIMTDRNYTSWRLFASDFTGVDVVSVQSLMVKRLVKYPYGIHNDIILIEIRNPGKQNVIDSIRKLEKLDFVMCAEPNYISYPADDF